MLKQCVFLLQSQRLKQRTDKHMKEKYSSYYKKLKCFQDPIENPEYEGSPRQCLCCFLGGVYFLKIRKKA